MAVNEVVVNGVKELSLVNDTVSEDTLLENATAHDASGKQITGKVVVTPVDSELNAESENAIQNKAVAEALQNVDAKTVDTQTLTAPTNAYTPFYPAFVDSNNASAVAEALKTNDAYIFQMKGGTTTAEGVAQLILGNTKLAGTDGNMQGRLVFYTNAHSYYAQLSGNANQAGNITCYLPATSGTLALNTSIPTIYTGALPLTTGSVQTVTLGVKPKFVLCYGSTDADGLKKWFAKSTSGGHANITLTNTGFTFTHVNNAYPTEYYIALA